MKVYLAAVLLVLSGGACSPSSEQDSSRDGAPPPAPVATLETTPGPARVDTVRGFGRYHFGDPMRGFPPLTLVHQSRPDLATYRVATGTDNVHFGSVPLTRVTYTFYRRELYGINYYASGRKGLDQLTREATARYGKPTQLFEGLASWKGKLLQAGMGRSPLDSTEAYYLQFVNLPMLYQLQGIQDEASDTTR